MKPGSLSLPIVAILLMALLGSCASHRHASESYPLSEKERPLVAPESIMTLSPFPMLVRQPKTYPGRRS